MSRLKDFYANIGLLWWLMHTMILWPSGFSLQKCKHGVPPTHVSFQLTCVKHARYCNLASQWRCYSLRAMLCLRAIGYCVVHVVCMRVVSASELVAFLCISWPPEGAQHRPNTALLSHSTNLWLGFKDWYRVVGHHVVCIVCMRVSCMVRSWVHMCVAKQW